MPSVGSGDRQKIPDQLSRSEVVRDAIDAWMKREKVNMPPKRKQDAIETALQDASRAAAEAFARLSNDPGPEAVKQARGAGRKVDAACRAAKEAIRKLKAKRNP